MGQNIALNYPDPFIFALSLISRPFNYPDPFVPFDAETGLHQNHFRDYDPLTGRYLQSDPIGILGGINTFGYVNGNPVIGVDPEGLETFMCTAPLHALGDKMGPALYPEHPRNPSPFFHQFICISDGKGEFTCGGQDRSERIIPWAPGRPSIDKFDAKQCRRFEGDNQCIETCINKKIQGGRPYYGLFGPGTNCQEWANNTITECRAECKKK